MISEDYLIEMDKKLGDFSKNISNINKKNKSQNRTSKEDYFYLYLCLISFSFIFCMIYYLNVGSLLFDQALPAFFFNSVWGGLAVAPLFLALDKNWVCNLKNEFNKMSKSFSYLIFQTIFISFTFTMAHFFLFGMINIMYCISIGVPKGMLYVEAASTSNTFIWLLLAFFSFGFNFYYYLFALTRNQLKKFNNDITNKLNNIELKEETLIDEVLDYLFINVKNTQNIDLLLFTVEEYELDNIEYIVNDFVQGFAEEKGFDSYRRLKHEELKLQQEMIYNE